MMKVGLPKDAVKHKATQEGVDTSYLDQDPEQMVPLNLDSPKESSKPSVKMIPLKDHPKYSKYFKMLKVGLPPPAVKHKMTQEGVDPDMLDKDPSTEVPENDEEETEPSGPPVKMIPLKDHPKYSKYFKMLKVGLPPPAVKQKMSQEGVNPDMLDKDPSTEVPENEEEVKADSPKKKAKKEVKMVKAKDHPDYAKYFKMLKVGLPLGAVQQKVRNDGFDPAIVEKDPEALIPESPGADEEEEGSKDMGEQVKLKDHPTYAQYFKMLKVGLPNPAVKHKMMKDGVDPDVLDKDPESLYPLDEQKAKAAAAKAKEAKKKKEEAKIRRKKLYWKPVEEHEVPDNSVWAETSDLSSGFVFDDAEFQKLFVSKVDPEEEKKMKKATQKKEKKDTEGKILDHKRATNAGIAIARIKMSYEDMRDAIMALNSSVFTSAQLQALPEYLPNSEETIKLKGYKGDPKKLGEAEKFMIEMMKVTEGPKRFQAMIYKKSFITRKSELLDTVRVLESACDDVKLSFKLKKLLGIILKLGNEMNQQNAKGFSFDTLLKLNQGKAFDQRTSILVFLIRLVMRNDDSLLDFKDDLKHIFPASRVSLDSITAEMKELEKGLEMVQHFKDDAAVKRLQSQASHDDVVKKMNSSDLKSQKTELVTSDEGVKHFNRATSGMEDPGDPEENSSLEEFLLRAEYKIKQLEDLIKTVTDKFQSVVKYYGQKEDQGPDKFFSTLHSFCKAFDASLEQIQREDAAKAREERIKQAKEARLAAKMNKKFQPAGKAGTRLDMGQSTPHPMIHAQSEKITPHRAMFDPNDLKKTAAQLNAENLQRRGEASPFRSPTPKNAVLEAIRGRGGNTSKDSGSPILPPPPPSSSEQHSLPGSAPPKNTAGDLQNVLRNRQANKSNDNKDTKVLGPPTAAQAPPSGPPRITANALQDMLKNRQAAKISNESLGTKDSDPPPAATAAPPRITANALQDMLQKKAAKKAALDNDGSTGGAAQTRVTASALQAMLQKRAAANNS